MSELVKSLAIATGLPEHEVRKIIVSAPVRYKTYQIDKKNGGKREISQPAREVKLLQRAFMSEKLKYLSIHSSATAYREGLSILDNAAPHANSGPILKLDLKNFFPSIRGQDWISYCRDTKFIEEEEDIKLSASLLFFKAKGTRLLRLAIGAPSSPMVSNALLFSFDEFISENIKKDKVIYTRYADDLTFSAPRTGYLNGVLKAVSGAIRYIKYPKLEINSDKTVYATPKYRRTVTGLILANDGRVTVGKEKKRILRAAVHHALNNKLSNIQLTKLSGDLAFVNSVEPDFLKKLSDTYGQEIIGRIKRYAKKSA